jgi:DNA-binding transcriptional LysR family regulator
MITLQQLKYIVEISRQGSITEAARKLFIAQPSLSKAVKDIEKEYHVELFKRSRQGVSFTVQGMEFLRFAQNIIDTTGAMEFHFKHKAKKEKNMNLSISSQHYMFVVDALIDFIKQVAPDVQYTLHVQEVGTSQVIRDVITQKSQVGIIYVCDIINNYMQKLFKQNNLEFVPFHDFLPYVYISKKHQLSNHDAIDIKELASYPYVSYEQGVDPYQFSEELALPNMHASKNIYVTDRSTMLSLIEHTDAYNLGTGCLVPRVVSDKIAAIPLSGNNGYMRIGMIKKKNLVLSEEMSKYFQLMQSTIQKAKK